MSRYVFAMRKDNPRASEIQEAFRQCSDDVQFEAMAVLERLETHGPRGYDVCDVLESRFEVYAIEIPCYPGYVCAARCAQAASTLIARAIPAAKASPT